MRIAKAVFIRADENTVYGTVAVALSLFVFAYSARLGPLSILVYYGLWLPLVLMDYRRVLGNYLRFVWIFGFAAFCFLSVFWSPAPGVSMRTAIQYLTHIVCALIAMRTLSTATLTRGAVVGCGIVLVYSLLFGVYHYDPLDGTYSFVGAFASKNQLGFFASLGLLFTYAGVMITGFRRLWLGAAAGTAALSAYSLLASQSATSVLTTLAVIALCIGLQVLGKLAPRQRKIVFAAGLVLVAIGANAALAFGAMDAVLGAFGKDSTLTGRTYLWQQGIEAARQSPIAGIGYQGYWVQGFPEAERLWEEFYIASRSGFHFHDTYIETMVETGVIGTVLLSLILLTGLFGHLKRVLHDDDNPEALVMFAILALLLVRSFVEIDIMHPYHVGSFLFYFAAGKLTLKPHRAVDPGQQVLAWPVPRPHLA
ncbi:O-antigen ligase family protein [Rhizobium straminoryzae]|uniref:O-antigen ligase family protein n=1 Tax=Rhizobium straminoryzae TaxID=1387186 RepID=A0A549TAD7_9HYPH|nr:O-antigen ligase [Rhizobium straminoryzae]TRL38833.1 O-antigen ligase family protein [Rhizobium straminoryzae]